MENNNITIEKVGFFKKTKKRLSNFFSVFSFESKSKAGKLSKGLFFFVLYALAVVGIVFGVLNLENGNNKKGLFGNSYTITYKLDTTNDQQKAEQETKNAAKSFSNWLLYKNISNNGVSYEVKQEIISGSTSEYIGYLFVNFTNIEQFYFEQLQEDVDVDPSLIGINNMNNSGIEVWQYNQPANYSGNNHNSFYMNSPILASSNFDYNTAKKDDRTDTTLNSLGVELSLQGNYDLKDGENFVTQAEAEEYDATTDGKLEWLVFQNMDVLVNRLNYAKYIVINHDKYVTKQNTSVSEEVQKEWTLKYESLNQYDSDLLAWAKIASFQKDSTTIYNSSVITKENLVKFYQSAAGVDSYSSYPTDANESLKTVVDKYLLGTITKDNYKQWLPTTASTINFEKQNLFSIQKSGATTSTQSDLIYQFKNTVLPVEFLQQPANASITNDNEFKLNGYGWMSNPFIKEGITKLSSYNAILLALGVVLLLIGIIVSVLYRIPGLMAAFAIIASCAFSASLLVLFNINFSIATVIGLFVGIILATTCISFSMERVRRLLQQKNSVFDSIQTAIKKSMLTTLDINATTIIMALSLFFFAKGELADLGLVLVLIPLLVLASIFVFFYFPLYVYSGARFSWKQNLNITPWNSYYRIKIWFNVKKWWFIWSGLILLVIIAIILLFTVGVNDSSFGNGTVVYIYNIQDVNDSLINNLKKVFDSDWYGYSYSDGVFEISSNNIYSYQEVQKLITNALTGKTYSLDVSTVSPTIGSKVFLSGIYGMLAGFGFVSLYYVIRANILTFIPMFFVNLFTCLITVSFSYVFQFPVSVFFIYTMVVAGIISNMTACLFVSVTKTRFNKKKIFSNEEIKIFITNNIKSLINTLFIVTILSFTSFVIASILVSPTTIMIFLNLAFVSVISMYISYFLIAHLYYFVIVVRQKYVDNIIYNIDNKINNKFSEVDEQLIYSINKFN